MRRAVLGGAVAVAAISGALIAHATTTTTTTTPAPQVPASCHARGELPDPSCTPGALNPTVTQATIHSTICVRGWTATVRPPVSYTARLKVRLMRAYRRPGLPSAYELDHLIPLELGGDPRATTNLWPEPWPEAHVKDAAENRLHAAVCAGQLSLAEARQRIATDWRRG